MPDGPVPEAWIRHGAPPEAVITFREGFCPAHRHPLTAGTFPWGGNGGTVRRDIPAGWCGECQAWWHRPVDAGPGMENGIAATWGPSVAEGVGR